MGEHEVEGWSGALLEFVYGYYFPVRTAIYAMQSHDFYGKRHWYECLPEARNMLREMWRDQAPRRALW